MATPKFNVGDRVTVNPSVNPGLAIEWSLPGRPFAGIVEQADGETYYINGWYVPFALVDGDPADELLRRAANFLDGYGRLLHDIRAYLSTKDKQG